MYPYEESARLRVRSVGKLWPYKHLLVEYEWDNAEEHWRWVATATIDGIVEWCESFDKEEST